MNWTTGLTDEKIEEIDQRTAELKCSFNNSIESEEQMITITLCLNCGATGEIDDEMAYRLQANNNNCLFCVEGTVIFQEQDVGDDETLDYNYHSHENSKYNDLCYQPNLNAINK